MHPTILFALFIVFLAGVTAQVPTPSAPAQCVIDCGNTIDVAATCGVAVDDDAGIVSCMCTNADAQAQFKTCAASRCPNVSNVAIALLKNSCDSLTAGAASPAAQCAATCSKASAQTIKGACPNAASGDPTALQQCLCTFPSVQQELSQCFLTKCSSGLAVDNFGVAAIDCGNILATNGNSSNVGAGTPTSSTAPSTASATGLSASATPTSDQQTGKNSAASFTPSLTLVIIASVVALM